MKTSNNTLALFIAAAAILSLASCHKDAIDGIAKTDRIITGALSDDATKTSLDADNVTPLWSVGDVIRVLDGTSYQDITLVANSSTPGDNEGKISSDNRSFSFATTLTGNTLYAVYPASATAMTSCSDGNISITVPSIQDGTFASANICVASGDGSASNTIYFSNATAVVEMTVASDVVGTTFNAKTNVAGDMSVAMGTNGTISGTTTDALSSKSISVSDTKAPAGGKFYLAVAPVETGKVTVSCNTTSKSGFMTKDTKTLAMDRIYAIDLSAMTIETKYDPTGQHGVLNGREYVLIKAKYDGTNDSFLKWATQNLAVTASGKAKWNGTDYVVGDYFQWAASYDGYGLDGTEGKEKVPANLVIYDSFTNTCAGGAGDSFVPKTGKETGFGKDINAPYCDGTNYTKYTTADGKSALDLTDDVANLVLGGSWRMPTGGNDGQLAMMKAATYWLWDAADKGYYVFRPGVGTDGEAGQMNTAGKTNDKTKALLFFPAAGYGNSTFIYNVGTSGNYSSGTRISAYTNFAFVLDFTSSDAKLEVSYNRYYGYSVRPVSD